jgi:hypothetical protein
MQDIRIPDDRGQFRTQNRQSLFGLADFEHFEVLLPADEETDGIGAR